MVINFLRKNISQIKYVFTFVYLMYFSFTYNCYVSAYLNDFTAPIYTVLIFVGIVILAVDFFVSGLVLRFKYSWLLILFYISLLISIFLNISREPIQNLKVVVWMLIQSFVLYTVNGEYNEKFGVKRFRALFEALGLYYFICSLISVLMFVFGFFDLIPNSNLASGYSRIGLIQARLFGVFTDPNYASICVLFSMIFIIVNMILHKDRLFVRIYHIIALIIDFVYVVLSRSRTTQICLWAIFAIVGFFAVMDLLNKKGVKGFKNLAISVLSALLAVVVSFSVYSFTNWGMGRIYVATSEIHTQFDENHDYEEDLIRDDVNEENISNNRFAIWKDYFELSLKRPFFGIGPRNEVEYIKEQMPDSFVAKREYSSHNGYLALLVGGGIIGTLLMFGFIIMNIYHIASYLIRRSGKGDKYYLTILLFAAILATAAIAAVSLKAFFFCNSIIDHLFWFTLGYTISLIRMSEPERYNKEPTAYRLSKIFRIKTKIE